MALVPMLQSERAGVDTDLRHIRAGESARICRVLAAATVPRHAGAVVTDDSRHLAGVSGADQCRRPNHVDRPRRRRRSKRSSWPLMAQASSTQNRICRDACVMQQADAGSFRHRFIKRGCGLKSRPAISNGENAVTAVRNCPCQSHINMRARTIVPEANEWVQTVMAIHGRGAAAKEWEGDQLRQGTQIELPVGTLCLVVNSISVGRTRREWQRLAILEETGNWLEIEHSSKTHRDGLAMIAGNLLNLSPCERLRAAIDYLHQCASHTNTTCRTGPCGWNPQSTSTRKSSLMRLTVAIRP